MACAPKSRPPHLRASARPMRTGCSPSSSRSRKTSVTPFRMRMKMQGRNSAMADPVLKFPPEQKGTPGQAPREKIAAHPRRRLLAAMRRYRRFLLLGGGPGGAGGGGGGGGRGGGRGGGAGGT